MGLLSPHIIFDFLHLQMVLPHFLIHSNILVLKERKGRKQFCPLLNSSTDNEGKTGENRMGVNIFLFSRMAWMKTSIICTMVMILENVKTFCLARGFLDAKEGILFAGFKKWYFHSQYFAFDIFTNCTDNLECAAAVNHALLNLIKSYI